MTQQRYCNQSDHNTLHLAQALGAYRDLNNDELDMVYFASRRISTAALQRWTQEQTDQLLSYLQTGVTMAEAARRMGRSPASVRKRISRISRNTVSVRMNGHG